MRPPAALPLHLAGRSFTCAEATAAGVSRARSRAADLVTESRGIRRPALSTETLLDAVAPYAALTPLGTISHTTAALLLGIPLPWRLQNEAAVHLTRPPGATATRRRNAVGHQRRLDASERTVIDGIAVTSPARTWLDLASALCMEDLVVAGDYLVSAHNRHFGPERIPLTPLGELREYLESKHKVRGVIRAREALELLRIGVDSPPETRLRLMLHDAGLPEFTPNFPIEGSDGSPPVWVDLGCPRFRTCVEYEGAHHLTPEKQASDRVRDTLTAERGWLQVKIYAGDLSQGKSWVASRVAPALRRNGWTPR